MIAVAIFFTFLGHFAATSAQAQGARPTHQRILSELDLIPPSWSQILPAIDRFQLVMGNAAVLDRETGLAFFVESVNWSHAREATGR